MRDVPAGSTDPSARAAAASTEAPRQPLAFHGARRVHLRGQPYRHAPM